MLNKYSKSGYIVYRVPMSNMPFDILAVNPSTKEVLFIEVKSRKSRLSERQLRFKKIIESINDWKVRYVVEVVD